MDRDVRKIYRALMESLLHQQDVKSDGNNEKGGEMSHRKHPSHPSSSNNQNPSNLSTLALAASSPRHAPYAPLKCEQQNPNWATYLSRSIDCWKVTDVEDGRNSEEPTRLLFCSKLMRMSGSTEEAAAALEYCTRGIAEVGRLFLAFESPTPLCGLGGLGSFECAPTADAGRSKRLPGLRWATVGASFE
mmetsp:Transcript_42701/g.110019  ORF Transcript_42701/g.110019 Transcript_42701/m.110019 type:complete len:189 (-) Transcript_42701:2152-2718(-)